MAEAERIEVIEGSGNVFADLGFENPDEERAKADLVLAIARLMRTRKISQAQVAQQIGLDQPQVSRLLRGYTEGYSTDRLMRILTQLGQDVEIRVRPKPKTANRPARVIVAAAPASVHEKKAVYQARKK
ncbi:MAG: helix-turn-helix domain-containing protein [Fimbriimonas sp.]